MIRKIILVETLLLLFFTGTAVTGQNVEVKITGIRSAKGQIAIGIFLDDETFQKEKQYLSKKFEKSTLVKGEMNVRFSLEPGTYGLSLLDDENSDGKMKYNFLGIPKEGFGFSDYYHTGFKMPKFKSFSFSIDKDQVKRITVRMR